MLLLLLLANVPLLVTQGTRGVAYPLVRASRYGMDPSYLETCESRTLVLVQAESKEAVNNLPGILQVEGVDGIFVGPLDLSASAGRIGAVDCDEVRSVEYGLMRYGYAVHFLAPCVA